MILGTTLLKRGFGGLGGLGGLDSFSGRDNFGRTPLMEAGSVDGRSWDSQGSGSQIDVLPQNTVSHDSHGNVWVVLSLFVFFNL